MRFFVLSIFDGVIDGQNKKSHLLFSFSVRIVIVLHFMGRIYLSKISLHHFIPAFHWLHLNNYTAYENKCFNPRNQNHQVVIVTRLNTVCVQMRYAIHGVHAH